MYYRVAIRVDGHPSWRWKSTSLASLEALFRFLQLFNRLPQDHLRVFSSREKEEMNEQLASENKGLGSSSVTAAQFLSDRRIGFWGMTGGTVEHEVQGSQRSTSTAVTSEPSWNAKCRKEAKADTPRGGTPDEKSISSWDMRRLKLELRAGGDHDRPYHFALPFSAWQALAWLRLFVSVQSGELQR